MRAVEKATQLDIRENAPLGDSAALVLQKVEEPAFEIVVVLFLGSPPQGDVA